MYPDLRTHSEASDHYAFDHCVRVVLEDQPVFACTRFALVAITQNVFRFRGIFRNERPLQASIEPRAAAPPQSRVLDFIDDRLRLHGERLLHGLVAVEFEIAVDVRRALSKALRNYAYLVGMGNQVSHNY